MSSLRATARSLAPAKTLHPVSPASKGGVAAKRSSALADALVARAQLEACVRESHLVSHHGAEMDLDAVAAEGLRARSRDLGVEGSSSCRDQSTWGAG